MAPEVDCRSAKIHLYLACFGNLFALVKLLFLFVRPQLKMALVFRSWISWKDLSLQNISNLQPKHEINTILGLISVTHAHANVFHAFLFGTCSFPKTELLPPCQVMYCMWMCEAKCRILIWETFTQTDCLPINQMAYINKDSVVIHFFLCLYWSGVLCISCQELWWSNQRALVWDRKKWNYVNDEASGFV